MEKRGLGNVGAEQEATEGHHPGGNDAAVRRSQRRIVSLAAAPASAPSICVVVPARDEAGTIGAALHALGTQVELDGSPFPADRYEIIVLANNCRDATAAVARGVADSLPGVSISVTEREFPGEAASIVHVRRALMDDACAWLLARGYRRGIIASTDADTVVAPTWLAATAAEIAAGADAVGGRILTSREPAGWGDTAARRYHLLDVAYRHLVSEMASRLDPEPHDPWPRHHQFFGASLAVTAETYRRVGGLPDVPVLEDMALGEALRRCDARVRHSPHVRVTTSARRGGRVEVGLSTQLGEWDALARDGVLPMVEPAAMVEQRARLSRALRERWHGARQSRHVGRNEGGHGQQVDVLAHALGISHRELAAEALVPRPFGMFADAMLAESEPWRAPGTGCVEGSLVPIDVAVAELRVRLAVLRREPPLAPLPARRLSPLEDVEPVALFPAAEAVG